MKKYKTNNYRVEKFGNKYLVTTDHCDFAFLDENQFKQLKSENFTDPMFKSLLVQKGILVNDKNLPRIVERFREKNSFLFQGPSLHIVTVTLRCDQKCIYCHAASKPKNEKIFDMDQKTAKEVVDFIFQSPSNAITIEFQGGEPLLNFEIIKFIIEYSKKLNISHKKDLKFAVVTNMNSMDEKKLDYLIKNEVGICTSLDGPKELNNHNRKSFCKIDSFSTVTGWINAIQREYERRNIKGNVDALITVTKESLKQPKEIVDTYVSLGLKGMHLRFLNNLGDARSTWNQISYSSEEFVKFWKKAMDHIIELNKKGVVIRERGTEIILRKIFDKRDPGFLDLRSPCGAAIGQMAYGYNGDLYPCDDARLIEDGVFKIGNVKLDKYSDVLTSNSVCSLISASCNDSSPFCSICAFKSYCGLCPTCSYAEHGNIVVPTPMTNRCKIFKEQFSYIFKKLQDPKAKKVFMKWIEN